MTLAQITKRVGCSRATIYKWLELPGFRQAVADRLVQFTEDRLPSIVHAMCDAAEEDRDVKAARFVHDDVLKKGASDLSDLSVFEALYLRLGVTPTSIPNKG
jgi:AcrR family transcriptional regulator